MDHSDLIKFIRGICKGEVFSFPSDRYTTIRELTGHGWTWACQRESDGRIFAIHSIDLLKGTRVGVGSTDKVV